MSNMLDYLMWRGDISFENSPVNEVDQLVFAYISYVIMDDFFTEGITVREAAEKYFEAHTMQEVQKDKSFIHLAPIVLKSAGESVRFGSIKMYNYQNDVNVSREEQFAAVCLYLDYDNSIQVAFRGTDDTIIGWKEDFNMSFIMPVPSQCAALKYLEKVGADSGKKLRICGHSKGGNLAVYSAAKCSAAVREQILSVYNLDGPGFNKKMLEDEGYIAVQSKITTIVPQSSVIGMLLEHEEEYTVIKSSQTGMLQHDGISWQALGAKFVYADDMDTGAKLFDASLKDWLSEMDNDQRKRFVDTLFDVLLASNCDTVSEFSKNSLSSMAASVQAMTSLPEEDRAIFLKTIGLLMTKISDKIGSNVKKRLNIHFNTQEKSQPLLDNSPKP
ncbi:MAG: DUF2974 domain-containing protein [Clostridia bacterium]|nr:DUF2974 domain-containing protein [Clostridia bacterium]